MNSFYICHHGWSIHGPQSKNWGGWGKGHTAIYRLLLTDHYSLRVLGNLPLQYSTYILQFLSHWLKVTSESRIQLTHLTNTIPRCLNQSLILSWCIYINTFGLTSFIFCPLWSNTFQPTPLYVPSQLLLIWIGILLVCVVYFKCVYVLYFFCWGYAGFQFLKARRRRRSYDCEFPVQ